MKASGRDFASANFAYASHVVERLEISKTSLALVVEALDEAASGGNRTLDSYLEKIREVLGVCRRMSIEYEDEFGETQQLVSEYDVGKDFWHAYLYPGFPGCGGVFIGVLIGCCIICCGWCMLNRWVKRNQQRKGRKLTVVK